MSFEKSVTITQHVLPRWFDSQDFLNWKQPERYLIISFKLCDGESYLQELDFFVSPVYFRPENSLGIFYNILNEIRRSRNL